jgi:dTDP-4-dehydrorhamnose 3,5-epimerase
MPIELLELTDGGIWRDIRGEVRFNNSLPVKEFARFYTITNSRVGEVRGWHAHKIESKAILAIAGKIRVGAVAISDWDDPTNGAKVFQFEIDAENPKVVLIPGGFANAIVSLTPGAIAGVFSSSSLEESLADDYRFDREVWPL